MNDKEYLTLVFKKPSKELVEKLLSEDSCVFMSWSHVPNEKEKVVKALQETKKL